jgi:peptide/nickel transport system substrate-binding protein
MARRRMLLLTVCLTVGLVLGAVNSSARPNSSYSSRANSTNCVKFGGVEDSGTKNNLEPLYLTSSQNALNTELAYDRLITRDDNMVIQPALAVSWKSNAAATVWTFELQKGVRFWYDHHELTSADVLYTFKRLLKPAEGAETLSLLKPFLNPSGIVATGRYTVQFRLKKPASELPQLLYRNSYIVGKGASDQQIKLKGAGTGPFIPVNFQPVQAVHLFTKNPD